METQMRSRTRRWNLAIKDNSLSIVLFVLFLVCISAQSLAGWRLQNETLAAHCACRSATGVFCHPAPSWRVSRPIGRPRLLLAYPPRYLITVHPRQADVQQRHVGSIIEGRFQSAGPSKAVRTSCPDSFTSIAKLVSRIHVVIHHQHPQGSSGRLGRFDRRRGGCGSGVGTTGRRTTNSLPCPKALKAATVPPCISTRRCTNASPMPNPPCERSRDRSACVNKSKIRGRISGAMPTPVSRTHSTASSPSCWTVSQTRPPNRGVRVKLPVRRVLDHLVNDRISGVDGDRRGELVRKLTRL